MIIVSLYDFTGLACRPWAEAGYDCFCFDLQHSGQRTIAMGKGTITFVHWDADRRDWLRIIETVTKSRPVRMVMGFPPCDDLAGSGSKHWAGKKLRNHDYQTIAIGRVKKVPACAEALGCDRWVFENPVGAISRLWRRFDYLFHPCWYGGYLPKDDRHPEYPEYIPPRDRYNKATCLWTGPGYMHPKHRKVKPEVLEGIGKDGRRLTFNRQTVKLGGKSLRTKNIRSATPRGWALANYLANGSLLFGNAKVPS